MSLFGGYNSAFTVTRCGCFIVVNHIRQYIPLLKAEARSLILANASRTSLTQTFINPLKDRKLEELRYEFPLYDGVSVVSFTCTINDRVIHGLVKERQKARETYDAAVAQGQTAGLLDQSLDASDVFTMRIGNVPAGALVKVEIVYLGELKHDAEIDGLRFTLPTAIAPRYASSELVGIHGSDNVQVTGGLSVTVDAQLPVGSSIKTVQSPSHPISVQIGSCSTDSNTDEPSLQKASATLSLGSAEMNKDFILQLSATKLGDPSAVLETHPTIPNQRALMATLVPKFNLPADKPEIVFVCDRSGSMGGGKQIPNLISALNIFLRSLPVGVKFNICSFGSSHEFLWPRAEPYTQASLEHAVKYVKGFDANFGGTNLYLPIEATFKRRYQDMNLEVFVLTDGEIWDQERLFELINTEVENTKGATRVFTLGIGQGVSHALIEGVARAGNGFAQTVADDEKMDKKVVRMLKGALTPHINDYSLEIKYSQKPDNKADDEDDFELIEKIESVTFAEATSEKPPAYEVEKPTISLFDNSIKDNEDPEPPNASGADGKFDHLPDIKTPTYLQTPYQIPTLFPFHRTNVYVLLSESTPNKVPKSVVLRGTSSHGPLELEIPITVLAENGQMIHQLAARGAVKELEEGRGWIFHAKDSKTDKLLKTQYDGRFSDMVEREAVRLGVTYQVGGKWCSFVAVDSEGDDTAPKKDTAPQVEVAVEHSRRQRTVAPMFGASVPSAPGGGMPPRPMMRAARGGLFGSFAQSSVPAPAPAPSSSLFGSGAVPPPPPPPPMAPAPTGGLFGGGQSIAFGGASPATTGGGFGSVSSATASSAFGAAQTQQPLSKPAGLFGGGQSTGFGQQSTQNSSLFGAASSATTGGLFGGGQSTQSTVFGQQATQNSGLFGSASSTTTGGLFGSVSKAAPPQSSPKPSLFGSVNNSLDSVKASAGRSAFSFGAPTSTPPQAPLTSATYAPSGPCLDQMVDNSASDSFTWHSIKPGSDCSDSDDDLPLPLRAPPRDSFNRHSVPARPLDASARHCAVPVSVWDDASPPTSGGSGFRAPPPRTSQFGAKKIIETSPGTATLTGDNLQDIIALQGFSGSWKWTDELETITGVKRSEAESAAGTAGLTLASSRPDILATVCALVFLHAKLSDEKDAWEMIESKARSWLEEQLGSEAAVKEWELVLEGLLDPIE